MDLQVKYVADDSVEKYKARFVAKGYAQKEGIDYEETFTPITRYTSIRTVISLATQMGWEIHQMDVKTTFLNGVIEEVYIEQPEGFETHEKKSHVYRLKKALYGLKQAPRAWIIQAHQRLQEECSHRIQHEGFGTDALSPGLEVWQQKGEIFLGQGRYTIEILKRIRMQDCRPMATPLITNWKKIDASEDKDIDPTLYRELIRSLIYLVNTRLDICYAVNTLSQFMVEPKRAHWAAAKHVLRYIQGTVEHRLLDTQGNDIGLSGFTYAD
eukprot:PITA_01732